MSTPFRAPINFFQQVIIYFCENSPNGLVAGESSSMAVRYFINYSHRDIDLDYESDIDEFGPKIVVRIFKIFG